MAQYVQTEVYLQPGLVEKVRSNRAILASLTTAVRSVAGVDGLLAGEMLEHVPLAADPRASFARSHLAGRSGDLTASINPGITLPRFDGRVLLEAVTSETHAMHESSLQR